MRLGKSSSENSFGRPILDSSIELILLKKDLIIPYSNANLIIKGINYYIFSLFFHILPGVF